MINSIYSKAYTEVLEILRHFPKEDYAKIPLDEIKFYQKNMDKDYKFTINPEIDLDKQNISKEANAIIVNLYRDYFATDEQKSKIKEILYLNQKKEEERKKERFDPDNIFKNNNKYEKISNNFFYDNKQLMEYKESFFVKFKKLIFRILHINK